MMPSETHDVARTRGAQRFRNLQALNELRNPVTRNLTDLTRVIRLTSLAEHRTIARGRLATAADDGDDFLLRVERPKLSEAPRLPESLAGWLRTPADTPDRTPEFRAERAIVDANGEAVQVKFDADSSRLGHVGVTKGPGAAEFHAFQN
jgi:hypothetical protein